MLINRTIYNKILDNIKVSPVTIITGSRQVGKSTICKELVKDLNFNYVSLDDTKELMTAKNDPQLFLLNHKCPLIIDEVQKCVELFPIIENVVNTQKFKTGNNEGMFVLTGSQSYSLMQNVSESLAGRATIVTVSPLSVRETKNLKENPFVINPIKNNKDADENNYSIDDLYDYIVRGFYPRLYENKSIETEQFYSDYVLTYIERDVSQIINLKDKLKFHRFMEVLASMTCQELVNDSLAKIIGVSVPTIESWISVLVAGNVISLIEPYYENSITKRVVKRPKVIFNDTGLAAFLCGVNNATILKKSIFAGRFVETFIINEIIKSYKNNGVSARFYYYRDTNQHEIDLIVQTQGNINLIECKSGVSFSYRDIKSFEQVSNSNFNICNSGIVCNTDKSYALGNGFFAVPINSI